MTRAHTSTGLVAIARRRKTRTKGKERNGTEGKETLRRRYVSRSGSREVVNGDLAVDTRAKKRKKVDLAA